ncbi:hypothetical protein CUJ83_08895 [Methanocella sp. CWC-04]|uniref:Cephalosporin-C deacetylase n=1 Tax=Methanooceanicella nereidis TaxID=2052831 RepID=A0AAP2RCX3_9EURY|nr:alpha/beta hydrolase [Methanocella sp. CWC-04]MCD1295113.1 hypothetical protein [Methanocella sp. CWC-04]
MLIEKGTRPINPNLEWLVLERFPFWEAWGADARILQDVCSKVNSLMENSDAPGGWTSEFMKIGDKCYNKAYSPAKIDQEKISLFNKASTYYGIARFPFADTTLRKKAYSKQKLSLIESSHLFPYNFEVVSIPFEGRDIKGYFYSPSPQNEITLPEGVLLTGGAEILKEDIHNIADYIVRNSGMACLTIDMPGTGESSWRLSEDSIDIYSKAIKYLAGRGGVDPNRIGIFGIGFGGYWAMMSAASFPEIKAAVNCGGPIHRAFEPDNLKNLPEYLKMTLAFIQGNDPDTEVSIALKKLYDFSLFKHIETGRITCPILSINGSSDPYVPIDDLFIISSEGGIDQDEWVFKGDKHCAPQHYMEWMPRMVAWLANSLGGKERMSAPDLIKL